MAKASRQADPFTTKPTKLEGGRNIQREREGERERGREEKESRDAEGDAARYRRTVPV